MPRSLSTVIREHMARNEADYALLPAVTIDYPDLAEPIRIVYNPGGNVVSRGDTFYAVWFNVQLPDEGPDQLGVATIAVDNVTRLVGTLLEGVTDNPTARVELLSASDEDADPPEFDTVEATYKLEMSGVHTNATVIESTLTFPQMMDRSWPKDHFSTRTHPHFG